MTIEEQIVTKIEAGLTPTFFEIENESHKHSGPSTTSHFRLVIVSTAFEGTRLIARHRKVNALLADELANDIHALALHTFTKDEWQKRGENANQSPNCAGG
jgi:BolA protein